MSASADEAAAAGAATRPRKPPAQRLGGRTGRAAELQTSVGGSSRYPGVCSRCEKALLAMDFPEVTLAQPPVEEAAAAA